MKSENNLWGDVPYRIETTSNSHPEKVDPALTVVSFGNLLTILSALLALTSRDEFGEIPKLSRNGKWL